MKSKRIKWLDFAKGLMILSVVMIHSLSYNVNPVISLINYILPIFAMPVFFAISGYLYKQVNNMHEYLILLYKKVTSFVIPYVLFTIILIILNNLNTKLSLLSYIKSILYHLWFPIGYLWFLYSLFFIFLFVGLFGLLHLNIYIQFTLSLLFMSGQLFIPWHINSVGNVNPIAGIGEYMVCFYIGYVIKKFNFSKFLSYKLVLISLIVLWALLMILQIRITGLSSHYNTDLFNSKNIICKLLSIPMFFSIFIHSNNINNKFIKYFTKYGKFTLVIYLVHLPIIDLINKYIFYQYHIFMQNYMLGNVFCIVLGWYLSIIICYIVKRYKFLNFIFYPRKFFNKLFLS